MKKAFADTSALEGATANPDENRMAGNYCLRNPALTQTPEIRNEIEENTQRIRVFSAEVHNGEIGGAGVNFKNFLLIEIGGSALVPRVVANAMGDPRTDKLKPLFFDNTDPNGMNRIITTIGADLNRTLCNVISRFSGTKETRNGMFTAGVTFENAHLDFGKHTVAVTMSGSALDKYSIQYNWLMRFPMWDLVSGRTGALSAVGLLPAALQGFNITVLIDGMQTCGKLTKIPEIKFSPAPQFACHGLN